MAAKKKSSKKKSGRKSKPGGPPIARRVINDLIHAEELIEEDRYLDALDILLALDNRHRNRVEIITMLADVYQCLGDWENCQEQTERLTKLAPREPASWLAQAQVAAVNDRPILARKAAQHFLKHWPDHPEAPHFKELVNIIEENVIPEIVKNFGLSEDQAIEVGTLHEQAQSQMGRGQYFQARKTLNKLISFQPMFAAAHNNLSQVYWLEGKLDLAIQTAQKVLEFESGNLHALSNLVHFHLFKGEEKTSLEYTECMLSSEAEATAPWYKKVEALAFLCEDEKIADVYQQAKQADEIGSTYEDAYFLHLTAVSMARLGKTRTAKKLWKQAVKLAPILAIAQENLNDLSMPIGEREGPYPFELSYWISADIIKKLSKFLRVKNETAFQKAFRQFLDQYPGLRLVIPRLLQRGGPDGRDFAITLIQVSEAPELLEIYRQYALGQDGPDQSRVEAMNFLKGKGLIQESRARLCVKGEWQDIQLLGFEISYEAETNLSPKAQKLFERAHTLMQNRDGEAAEPLLKQALEMHPHNPSILQNLSAAYQLQGRVEESAELVKSIHERFPDYLFARLALARLAINEGDFERAQELIDPILSRDKLHVSEFTFLTITEIDLALAKGDKAAAESWLAMWEGIDPEDERLFSYKIKINGPDFLDIFKRVMLNDDDLY